MKLTKSFLEKLAVLDFYKSSIHNNDIIFKDNNYTYKIFDINNLDSQKLNRNIYYLMKNSFSFSPIIVDKISYKGKTCGYISKQMKNSISLKEFLYQDMDEKVKLDIIMDMHKILKFFHSNNIILGEISLDSFFLANGNLYITNLENMCFPNDDKNIKNTYNLRKTLYTKTITNSSKYTDIIKLTLISLSLLTKLDLEEIKSNIDNSINLEYIIDTIISAIGNKKLTSYFEELVNGNEIYFDDFLMKNGYIKNKTKIRLHE